jgi:hypothetical protein
MVVHARLSGLRSGRRLTSGFVAFRSAKAALSLQRKATFFGRPNLRTYPKTPRCPSIVMSQFQSRAVGWDKIA